MYVCVIGWQGPNHSETTTRAQKKGAAKVAQIGSFKPPSKKDLYAAEFYARQKQSWGDLAGDLETLAFLALEEETLAFNQYLAQAQITLSVRQQWPKPLVEAVSYTTEI